VGPQIAGDFGRNPPLYYLCPGVFLFAAFRPAANAGKCGSQGRRFQARAIVLGGAKAENLQAAWFAVLEVLVQLAAILL